MSELTFENLKDTDEVIVYLTYKEAKKIFVSYPVRMNIAPNTVEDHLKLLQERLREVDNELNNKSNQVKLIEFAQTQLRLDKLKRELRLP
jgi:ATP-dependent helicase/DNAse subunit B